MKRPFVAALLMAGLPGRSGRAAADDPRRHGDELTDVLNALLSAAFSASPR